MNPWILKMLVEAWNDRKYSFERTDKANFGQRFPQAAKKYPYLKDNSVGDLPTVTIPGNKHTVKSAGLGAGAGALMGGLFAFGEGIKRKFPVVAGATLAGGALAGGVKYVKMRKGKAKESARLAQYQSGSDKHATYRPIATSEEYNRLSRRNMHIRNKTAELMHKTHKGTITNQQAKQELDVLKKKYGRV